MERSPESVLESLRAIASLTPLEIGPRIVVDTEQPIDVEMLVHEIERAFSEGSGGEPPEPDSS